MHVRCRGFDRETEPVHRQNWTEHIALGYRERREREHGLSRAAETARARQSASATTAKRARGVCADEREAQAGAAAAREKRRCATRERAVDSDNARKRRDKRVDTALGCPTAQADRRWTQRAPGPIRPFGRAPARPSSRAMSTTEVLVRRPVRPLMIHGAVRQLPAPRAC